jgi:hypothetical protein
VLLGIKMTHKVAGPLYKVTLYLAKMRDGRYDKVYDLRKGDQLVEFYEHFKHAHAGVVALEQADVDRIAAALDAAIGERRARALARGGRRPTSCARCSRARRSPLADEPVVPPAVVVTAARCRRRPGGGPPRAAAAASQPASCRTTSSTSACSSVTCWS